MTINHVSGVRADIAQMLDKIREVSHREKAFQHGKISENPADFSKIMESTQGLLGNVSNMQNQTENLKDRYISGDPNVSLSQVVVSSEKSKIAFEGLIIVRNKCLEAYKEIMNMPV